MREIQRWHLERGWATVGYHFVLSPSGRVFLGRPVDRLGAHVLGHNVGTVGIALMGNFELERPTPAALESLTYVRDPARSPAARRRGCSAIATTVATRRRPARAGTSSATPTNAEGRLPAALRPSVEPIPSGRALRS